MTTVNKCSQNYVKASLACTLHVSSSKAQLASGGPEIWCHALDSMLETAPCYEGGVLKPSRPC